MHASSSQPARILLDLTAELTTFRPKWIQLLISAPKSRRRWIGTRECDYNDNAKLPYDSYGPYKRDPDR
jgi:hypothetical protein